MKYALILFSLLVPLFVVKGLMGAASAKNTPAAGFTVNNTADATDTTPGDGICETAAGNQVCTLRAAIQEANALAGMDMISLPAGTYPITIPGVNEDSAASADLDITDDLILTGAGMDITVIDGSDLDHIFHILGPNNPTVEISGLTIQNGNTFQPGIDYFAPGGGIYNNSGVLTLLATKVSNNYGGEEGGGIYNAGTLIVSNSVISNNETFPSGGGIYNADDAVLTISTTVIDNNSTAVWHGGGIHNRGILTLTSSTISNNVSGDGGGIYNDYGSLDVSSTVFSGNQATEGHNGGAIYDRNSNSPATRITNSTFSNNTSTFGGGAISVYNGSHMFIDGSVISSNTANLYGGGIESIGPLTITHSTINHNETLASIGGGGGVYAQSRLTILNSTIHHNVTDLLNSYGGGIYLATAHPVDIVNSTISGNQGDKGGGIGLLSGELTLINTTIFDNSALTGGGIYDETFMGSTASLFNTIIAGNQDDNCFNDGDITSAGHNLDSGNTCGFSGPSDLINTDPLLGPLQANGGPTWTHALAQNSPAVDAGDNTVCPAQDQRGAPRPADGDEDGEAICDIGAYEVALLTHHLYLPATLNTP